MITLKKAKKAGFSQSVGDCFLSSRYHPQKEAQNLLDAAMQNAQQTTSCPQNTSICHLGLFPLDILALSLAKENISHDWQNIFFFEGNNIDHEHYQKALKNLLDQKSPHFLAIEKLFDQKYRWQKEQLVQKICQRIGDEQKLQEFLQKQNDEQIKNIVVIQSSYLREEKVKKAAEIIRWEKIKRQAQEKTTKMLGDVWTSNKKRNLSWWAQKKLNPPLAWIRDFTATADTAIFVSAGPSTEKNIENLRFWSDKYPIYTVAGMAGVLLKNEVKIKAVIATDPGYYQKIHFDSLSLYAQKYQQKIPVIAPLSCCFGALKNYAGSQTKWHREKSIFFYLDERQDGEKIAQKWLEKIKKNPDLEDKKKMNEWSEYLSSIYCPNDASVSLSALRILHLLQHQKIVTLGCDFTCDGFAYHSQGYAQEEYFFTRVDKFNSFENWLQKSFFFPQRTQKNQKTKNEWSDQKWMLYRQHFGKIIAELRKKNCFVQDFEAFLEENWENKNCTANENKRKKTTANDFLARCIVLALLKDFEEENAQGEKKSGHKNTIDPKKQRKIHQKTKKSCLV